MLENEFKKFSIATPQETIQAYFESEYHKNGLPKVLDLLFEWERKTGYITDEKLEWIKKFTYPDSETGVRFRAQINYARDRYSPKAPDQKNSPKLHCSICYENIGTPGKKNLRVFRFHLDGSREFFIQLTPFPIFPQHYVLIEMAKNPMRMDQQSVSDLVRFIELAPGYAGCSNSDVEWAGASILTHHHYQVFGDLCLPIMEATFLNEYHNTHTAGIEYGLLHYPIACCKICAKEQTLFAAVCGEIISAWKKKEPGRNTCNLVIRKENAQFCCYLIFRNPAYRTSAHFQKYKTEGVGVLEVSGEAIYPVPKGENTDRIWNEIENDGLEIIKGIIADNNPVKRNRFDQHFDFIHQKIEQTIHESLCSG